ncbi:hypothetical protein V1514DRAFT_337303 [Lipomyces japonicus]|uniref:uncharacterized protein n=1 Tax=Lipomyces japonicus TaxID=56871 RepID=UPI0034CE630F
MPPVNYAGKLVLAPMVRIGEFPFRLLALKYGADLVWGPEIVDRKILDCKRVVNDKLHTIDYVLASNASQVIFRTDKRLEKDKVIFQLGTASPELAVQAASKVAADVAGIDLNSGCPKHFSVHSGMGAGLLKTPDKLVAILEALVTEVGKKFDIGISVKIRILDTPEETFTLVRRLVKTGISALTVHCRKVPMRPRERAIPDEYLAGIAEICHAAGIPCIANGDVTCRDDFNRIKKQYGVDSAMIAVAAESNVSCFAAKTKNDVKPWSEIVKNLYDLCKSTDNHYSNSKFMLLRFTPGKSPMYQRIAQSKSYKQGDEVMAELANEQPQVNERQLDGNKRKLENEERTTDKRKTAKINLDVSSGVTVSLVG